LYWFTVTAASFIPKQPSDSPGRKRSTRERSPDAPQTFDFIELSLNAKG
jgi:hypothetical protein